MAGVGTLQAVDPDDLTTVLFDFNDPTGASNPGGIITIAREFQLRAPPLEADRFSPQAGDGGLTTQVREDLVVSAWRLHIESTSVDNLREGIAYLNQLLVAGCVIKVVLEGSSQGYYMDVEASPPVALLEEPDDVVRALASFQYGEGILIEVVRQPFLRWTAISGAKNLLPNSTMTEDGDGSGRPDGWTWDNTGGISAEAISETEEAYSFAIATASTRNFRRESAAATVASGNKVAAGVYAKVSAGTNVKARAVLEFLDSGGGVLATHTGTLITLGTTSFSRLSVGTPPTAPASTDRIRVGVRFENSDATSRTVYLRRALGEIQSLGLSTYVVAEETVTNDVVQSFGKHMWVYNPGDAPAQAVVRVTPGEAAAKLVAVELAVRSAGHLTELANEGTAGDIATFRRGWRAGSMDLTGGTDAAVVDDTANGAIAAGSAVRINYATETSMVERARWERPQTSTKTLRGRWHLYASIRIESGGEHDVSIRWGTADRDPLSHTAPLKTFDATDLGTSHYFAVKLATLDFPSSQEYGLFVELWTRRASGTGNIYFDQFWIVPADEQISLVQVPGFRQGEQGSGRFQGDELTSQPYGCNSGSEVVETSARLNAQYEGVGIPPQRGRSLQTGRHVWTANVRLKNKGLDARTIGVLRVRRGLDAGKTASVYSNKAWLVGDIAWPTSINGRTYRVTIAGTTTAEPAWPTTKGGTVSQNGVQFTETTLAQRELKIPANRHLYDVKRTVAYQVADSNPYEVVVIQTDNDADVSVRAVRNIRHAVFRSVDGTGQAIRLDQPEGRVFSTALGVFLDPMLAERFVEFPPGLSLLFIDLWDLPDDGYDDLDQSAFAEPVAKYVANRTAKVAVTLTPNSRV